MTATGLGFDPGDATPLVAGGEAIVTRGDLARRSAGLQALIREHGVHRAMVVSDDPVDILRAIDATAATGADLFIAHTSLPQAHLDEIRERFGIGLIVAASDSLHPVEGSRPPDAPHIHMMTSGTTGRPKIARHSLSSLLGRVRAARAEDAGPSRWLLTYQPTGFAGVQVILTAAVTGGLVVAPPQRTPAGFYQAARDWQVARISGTPTFWRAFLMVAEPGALDLAQVTLGGEAADQSTLDRLAKAFPKARVSHTYASTEAGVVFAVHDGREGFPAAWLDEPPAGVALRVRDGFLHIRTANRMDRYVTDGAQPVLDDGWLATADRCEVVGDRVRVIGREDATINVGGSKVYPLSVETVLLGLPGVVEARVFGVPNPISGALVGAEVVLAPGIEADAARTAILAECRARLAGYQVPRVFRIVDSIASAPSGKKGAAA